MQKKLEYTIIGCTLSLANMMLIETRFNIVGLGFGILAAGYFIAALRIRK